MRSLSDDTKKTVNSKIMHKLSVNCGAGGSTQSVYLSLLRLINPIYLSVFHVYKVNEIFLDILG